MRVVCNVLFVIMDNSITCLRYPLSYLHVSYFVVVYQVGKCPKRNMKTKTFSSRLEDKPAGEGTVVLPTPAIASWSVLH